MVRLGIDRITEYSGIFSGKRIGLVTNYSGVSSDLIDDLTVFHEKGFRVTKLFTPEHGLYGAMDGAEVLSSRHPVFGIPIYSLYGDKLKPSLSDLSELDVLVYDIQDVGLRYYTYIYTLANVMQAADEAKLPLVVLDRPNPLGNRVDGNRMDARFDCFVGAHRLALRYGLTAGEIGSYFRSFFDLSLEYTVVPMSGYRSSMFWPETGQLWNLPSPSIHTFSSALCYVGGCFFEATNVSEGRGTAEPFQIYGAPFIRMDELYKEMKPYVTSEFAYRTRAFTPFWSKHAGETCYGLEFIPLTERADFLPVALRLLKVIHDLYGDQFAFRSYADVSRLTSLSGDTMTDGYIAGKCSFDALMDSWKTQAEEFEKETMELRIYEP